MGLLGDGPRAKRPGRKNYKTTTIRQFDGGWNIVDNELNLSPRYATQLDNMVRGPDGSLAVRPGYTRRFNLEDGAVTSNSTSRAISYTNGSRRAVVTWAGHPYASGDLIRFSEFNDDIPGVFDVPGEVTYSVRVINANSFDVILGTVATATGSTFTNGHNYRYTHIGGMKIVNGTFFEDHLVLVTDSGQIVFVHPSGSAERVWDNPIALALTDNPNGWGHTTYASFNIFGGNLHVHNGRDKPVELDFDRVPVAMYLGDPGTGGTNAYTPVGSYAITSSTFMLIAGIYGEPTTLAISAEKAGGVWADNPDPATAVDIDMGKVTNTGDAEIMGLGELRGKALVCYRNGISIGSLGNIVNNTVGTDTVRIHEPNFNDNISEFGTAAHRSIASLGNDVLMCDHTGVPSVSLSQVSANIVPDRVSELVEPAIQANLSRLTDSTLQQKMFAVYNSRDRQYILFMPKYEEDESIELENTAITLRADLPNTQFLLDFVDHGTDLGDNIVLDIAVPMAGFGSVTEVTVIGIIDKNQILVEKVATHVPVDAVSNTTITARRTADEYGVYVLTYNPKLRIRAWSKWRGLNFDWGARNISGKVFFGKDLLVYEMGSTETPMYGDDIHDGNPEGTEIFFVWEWPWGDFDQRLNTKALRAVYPDAQGTGQFKLDIFGDLLYKDDYGRHTPLRSLTFTASNAKNTAPADRRTLEPHLWPVPVNGKLHKFRISGGTNKALRFISLSMVYSEGSMKR